MNLLIHAQTSTIVLNELMDQYDIVLQTFHDNIFSMTCCKNIAYETLSKQ